ncbi:sensor histidine kinase [Paenibacillus sp. sgz500958]|uniref:sensor histidine kinase n=1 Tax=Paenibacillus sp. sgz500958 TaxID=3242475 RepID=UPI0036D327BB
MRKNGRISRFRQSLLSRYLLIIMIALIFLPIIIPISFGLYNELGVLVEDKPLSGLSEEAGLYASGLRLEKMWHAEALHLKDALPAEVDARLEELSRTYTRSMMFWVDGEGETQTAIGPVATSVSADAADREDSINPDLIPAHWTAAQAISFMKEGSNGDPFTIVAFIGDKAEAGQGFMVMQLPRIWMNKGRSPLYMNSYGWVLIFIVLLFAAVSWLFFEKIRRRLLRLQRAMTTGGQEGFPDLIPKGKPDEIGMLEEAFNTMVTELKDSRRRELEEEGLRKRLISDLSHDLRTPLTVVRSHVYTLGTESLSEEGRQSLRLMDERIADLSVLIDNLLSYNLLTSGRVILKPERKDVLRLMRESAAAWYPLWEKEGFEVDIDLEGEPLYWEVDEIWFRRVLDNLYQNIMRHASSGRYVGLFTEIRGGSRVIIISDHGQGLQSTTGAKGAGLGLSIVDLLLGRMKLMWNADSSSSGTSIVIFAPGDGNLNKT